MADDGFQCLIFIPISYMNIQSLEDYVEPNFIKITRTNLPKLNRLYQDLFSGGKGIRARLVRDISKCLDVSSEGVSLLCESVENIHHSSILHDDVIDGSPFRRNRLAAWVKFSKKEAILAGDYLMAQVSFRISETGNLRLLKLTSKAIQNMVQGEWLQREIIGRETLKELDQVHIFKTSALFEWSVCAPFLFLQYHQTPLQSLLSKIGVIFGQLFQRADDAIDFGIRNKENKKEFKDLKEGYLNFFGVYLKENIPVKNVRQLRACRNLRHLKKIIGESNLEKQVQFFDKRDQQLKNLCLDHINQLSGYLNKKQKTLIPVLNLGWISFIYVKR